MLSLLEDDPLELWVLEWKRWLCIMTLERRHEESKHILGAMVTMLVTSLSALNVGVYSI